MRRTRADIIATIAAHPQIDSVSDEGTGRFGDGVWAYTETGWCNGDIGTHTIHENTPSRVLRRLREIRPCTCDECWTTMLLRTQNGRKS